MNRISPLTRYATVAIAVAVVGFLVVAALILPVQRPAAADRVSTEGQANLLCPALPTDRAESTVALAAPDAAVPGDLSARRISETQADPVPAGALVHRPGNESPVQVRADGARSAEFGAAVLARSRTALDRGLSVSRCLTPSTEAWFAGVYSSENARSEIELINPDSAQATVDLQFFGADGERAAPGGRGITVDAKSSRVVAVESLFTSDTPTSVHLTTSIGRVAAVVRQRTSDRTAATGTDWLAPATLPRTSQVIPAVPGGTGERELVVANPGERRTTARVEIITADGTVAPADADQLDVNARSTATIRLDAGLKEAAAAVRITTDQPVIASVRAVSADDVAFTAAADPLQGRAVAAIGTADGVAGTLQLSNTADTTAVVPVTAFDESGEVGRADVEVPAHGTATWSIPGTGSAVLVDAGQLTGLYGGVVLRSTNGPGLASTGLTVPAGASGASAPQHDPGVAR
ncbi:DUF5719 family protein [Granulicoccus phenolivorans]|uniref:DUF5719 family protein n=1 Tax=Granulicoccus phenolivorans TaxID=266854 RepID=UPI0004045DEF|nr:DUF5719 family protein [Granulicoccus phenolivorans]